MKRNLSMIIIILLSCASIVTAQYGGGSGSQYNPYMLSTPTHLQNLMNTPADWSACYIMTASINASGLTPAVIGNETIAPFTGTFDGQGYAVVGLAHTIGINCNGLFGYANNATIINLEVRNCNLTATGYVGAIVGYAVACTISNCSSSGSINATDQVAGGIVGGLKGGTVTNSSSTCAVWAYQAYAGGFVGWVFNGGTITNCTASGNISITYSPNYSISDWGYCGGGFVGANGNWDNGFSGYDGGPLSPGHISYCSASGNVSVSNTHAGGFAGENNIGSTILHCGATGTVTGYKYVGGFVGSNHDESARQPTINHGRPLIQYCFSNGNATSTGGSYAGGFAGWNLDNGDIKNCYSSGNAVSGRNAAGGFCGGNLQGATITDCYSLGSATVSGSFDYIGGFCGWAGASDGYTDYPEFTRCFSVGNINYPPTATAVGGFLGEAGEINDIFNCCFFNSETAGTTISTTINGAAQSFSGIMPKTTAEMKSAITFTVCSYNDFRVVDGSYPGLLDVGAPSVSTGIIQNIVNSSAVAYGNITAQGDGSITTRGFCWNTTGSPTVSDAHSTENGSFTLGSYSASITGLQPNTVYKIRSYAISASGEVGYGNEVTFTTIPTLGEWGLIAFVSLVAVIGGIFVWRRIA